MYLPLFYPNVLSKHGYHTRKVILQKVLPIPTNVSLVSLTPRRADGLNGLERRTLYFAYFANQSNEVIPSLNLPVFENLPKHVPRDIKFDRATEVAKCSIATGR